MEKLYKDCDESFVSTCSRVFIVPYSRPGRKLSFFLVIIKSRFMQSLIAANKVFVFL